VASRAGTRGTRCASTDVRNVALHDQSAHLILLAHAALHPDEVLHDHAIVRLERAHARAELLVRRGQTVDLRREALRRETRRGRAAARDAYDHEEPSI